MTKLPKWVEDTLEAAHDWPSRAQQGAALIRYCEKLTKALELAWEMSEFYAEKNHYSCWCEGEWLDDEDELRHTKHEWEVEDGKRARDFQKGVEELGEKDIAESRDNIKDAPMG